MGAHVGGSLRAAAVADLRAASGVRRLALIGVVAWMAYEWGPGNETVTPWILARVIADHRGPGVIVVSASVGFVFTTVQQLASGFTALAGFSMFARTTVAAAERLGRNGAAAPVPWERVGPLGRCALAFGLGTTAVALLEIVATRRVGVRTHASVVVRSALLCGWLVAALAALAAALAFAGRRSATLAGPTERALDVLGNPLLWLGVLVALVTVRWLRADRGAGNVAC